MTLAVPDDLWAALEPLLQPERPKPKGGRAGARALRTARRSPASCSCYGRAPNGTRCRALWAAAAIPAGAGCATGTRPASGPRCTASCWNGCTGPGGWTGAGPRSTAPACPRKRGCGGGAEPHGPGQARHEAPPPRGRPGTPLGVVLSGATHHDSTALASTLDAVPPVRSGRGAGRGGARPSSTPTRPTTTGAAAASAGSAGSGPASRAEAWRAASASAGAGESWSARWRGWPGSGASQ